MLTGLYNMWLCFDQCRGGLGDHFEQTEGGVKLQVSECLVDHAYRIRATIRVARIDLA